MVFKIIHLIGTSAVLILIAYLFVDIFKKKKVSLQDVVSHVFVLIILFLVLLRT